MSTESGYVDGGQLKVDVVADLRGFARRLQAQVNAETKNIRASVEVEVNSRGLKTRLREAVAEASKGVSARVGVDVDVRELRAQVRKVTEEAGKGARVPVDVGPDPKRSREQTKAVKTVAEAQTELRAAMLRTRLAALGLESAQDRLAAAEKKGGKDSLAYRRAVLAVEAAEVKRGESAKRTTEAIRELQKVGLGDLRVDADVTQAENKLRALTLDRERKVTIPVDADTKPADRAIDSFRARLVALVPKILSPLAAGMGKVGSALAGVLKIAAIGGAAATAAVGLAQLVAQLGAFVAAAAPAAGLVIAIPAALGALGLTVAAVKVGLTGMGDAMKAIAEGDAEKLKTAMANLSPAARAVVFQLALLKPRLTELRKAVQDSLLDKLGPVVQKLATNYLPPLQRTLVGIAAGFNQAGLDAGKFLNRTQTVRDLSAALAEMQGTGVQFTRVIVPALRIFTDLVAVGAPLVRELAGDFADVATQVADFIAQARTSGQLEAFLRNAVNVAGQLVAILKNVGSVFGSVLSAANQANGGLLNTVQQLTGTLASFLNSAEGKTALLSFFTSLRVVADAVSPVLTTLVGVVGNQLAPAIAAIAVGAAPALVTAITAIGSAIQALTPFIGPVFAGIQAAVEALAPALAPLATALGQGLAALAPALGPLATAFASLIVAVTPLLPLLGQVLANGLTQISTLVVALAPMLGVLIGAFASSLPLYQAVGLAFAKLFTAIAPLAASFATALIPVVEQMAPIMVQLANTLLRALLPVLPQLVALFQQLAPILVEVAGAGIKALLDVIVALMPQLPALIQAGLQLAVAFTQIAIALLPLLPPFLKFLGFLQKVGLVTIVIPIIQRLAIALQVAATVVTFVSGVLEKFVGFIRSIPGRVSALWDSIVSGAQTAGGKVKDFFTALPGVVSGLLSQLGSNIASGLSTIGSILAYPFKKAWDGVKAVFSLGVSGIVAVLVATPFRMLAALLNLASVMLTFFTGLWVKIGTAFHDGIDAVIAFGKSLPGRYFAAVAALNTMLSNWASNIWATVKQKFTAGFEAVLAFGRSIPNRYFTAVAALQNLLNTWAANIWANIKARFTSGVSATVSFFAGFPGRIMAIVTPLKDRLVGFIGSMMAGVKKGFSDGVTAIGKAWDGLKEAAAKPVRFVVNTVIGASGTTGILGAYNRVAKIFNGGHKNVTVPGYAAGGISNVTPGYTPGRDVHRFVSSSGGAIDLSGGEAIMRPEWTAAVGGASHVDAANSAARRGGVAGVRRFLGGFKNGGVLGQYLGGFEGGGVLGFLKDKAAQAKDWVVGNLASLAEGPLKAGISKLIGQVPGGGPFVEAVKGLPSKLLSSFVKWTKDKDSAAVKAGTAVSGNLKAGMGTPSVNAILSVARRFFPGAQVSSGKRNSDDYHGRGLAADLIGGGASGMRKIAQGFYNQAGSLLELIHSNGNFFVKNGMRVGSNYYRSVIAEHFNHVHVAATAKALGFDSGGDLPVGTSVVRNDTGRPESVFTTRMLNELIRRLDSIMAAVRKVAAPAAAGFSAAVRSAAAEIYQKYTSGSGFVFEDFSFYGNSENVRQNNGIIADLFNRAGVPNTPDGIEKFLQTIVSNSPLPIVAGSAGLLSAQNARAIGATTANPAPAAGGDASTVNVYPREGQSEREIGVIAAKELEWARSSW